jgi:hypothetical protein
VDHKWSKNCPGDCSYRIGVSPDTIRHYERIGVLPRASRTDSGYRLYPASAVDGRLLSRRPSPQQRPRFEKVTAGSNIFAHKPLLGRLSCHSIFSIRSHWSGLLLSWETPYSLDQQQPHALPRMASLPSHKMSGTITRAAIGSAHLRCQIALIPRPTRATKAR